MPKGLPEETIERRSRVVTTVAAVFVALAWTGMFVFQLTASSKYDVRGQFGDSFGSLNTLFTGLAFVGVAYSIRLQQQEARKRQMEFDAEKAEREREYAKRDLEIERARASREKELSDAEKERVKAENRAARVEAQRRFDDHFFRHADTLRSLVASTSVANGDGFSGNITVIGRAAFGSILDEIKEWITKNQNILNSTDPWISGYEHVFKRHHAILGPYFRVTYRIFKYLEEKCPDEDRHSYAKLIRAEFSSDEVALHALNAFSERGRNFLRFYEKYALLKHMVPESFTRNSFSLPGAEEISGEHVHLTIKKLVGEDAFIDHDESPNAMLRKKSKASDRGVGFAR